MANGRLKKEPGYCDYQFTDGTYCKEKIAGEFLNESGKKVTRTGWEDKEKRNYCLFHSHNNDKGEFFYPEIKQRINNANTLVKKKLGELDGKKLSDDARKEQEYKIRNEKPLDFEGFYFPKKADFNNSVFEASVSFYNATFGGETSFLDATFGWVSTFDSAKFVGEATFDIAKFVGVASFQLATFSGKASFHFAIFGGDASFSGATFGGVTIFGGAKFDGNAGFSGAKFEEFTSFWAATFDGVAYFDVTKFGGEAYFQGAKFSAVIFEEATFGGEAIFGGVTFRGEASLERATFRGEASFYLAKFSGVSTFNNATFGGAADFEQSLFHQSTAFTRAACLKKLDFSDAAFLSGKLDFTRAKFPAEDTLFHNTVFNCEVLFHEQMLKGVRFTGCYLGSASFYGSDVRDAVFINSSWNRRFLKKQIQKLIEQKRIGINTPVLEISKIFIGGKRRVVLLDEYIYQYSKTTSIPEKIKIWIVFGFIMFWRGIKVYIKELFKKKTKPSVSAYILEPSKFEQDPLYLEHLYCQFKLAMDNNKIYGLANDFYHGEKLMETKRLWNEHSYLQWLFLRLYWLLSGFGNRPWRTIISLIFVLFVSSSLLIRFNGLTMVNQKEAYERCPCKTNQITKAVTVMPYSREAAIPAKVERSFISGDMLGFLVSLNTLDKLSKEMKQGEIYGTGPPKVQARYSPKCNYLCNVFFVSLWNLTATPGGRSDYYREKGLVAYLVVFCIQYIFRPLMIALIIISVRRRVYRG